MPVGWSITALGNVINLLSGRDLDPSQYSDIDTKGIPYITGASNFVDSSIITNRSTIHPQVISKYDDILISVKGTIGELALNPYNEAHIARQVMAVQPYLLNTNFTQKYLYSKVEKMKSKAQSMIPGISRDVLLKLSIKVPPIKEQNRIALTIEKVNQVIQSDIL